jgi:D-alanine-D-alanine ligase
VSDPRRLRVGVLFGGQSAEHEVSLQSARNVIEAIDPKKYQVVLLGIDRAGRWHLESATRFLLDAEDPRRIRLGEGGEDVALVPGDRSDLIRLGGSGLEEPLDVIFPVLHGPLGEDGTVQGLLRLANIPFVGSGVLGSAVAMDKDVAKRLLRDSGIPVADWVSLRRRDPARPDFARLAERLGLPLFVKPANMGSSVGVHRVADEDAFEAAVKDAFAYDRKVLVEEHIDGREIECAVLGNEAPLASVPGEIIPRHDFYSYEAKYLDQEGADLVIPADLSEDDAQRVQDLAIRTFQALCCEGMARVDFFLQPGGRLLVNELNSIPGFTRISMYPKLWEATGLGYSALVDRLIELALERGAEESALRSTADL